MEQKESKTKRRKKRPEYKKVRLKSQRFSIADEPKEPKNLPKKMIKPEWFIGR